MYELSYARQLLFNPLCTGEDHESSIDCAAGFAAGYTTPDGITIEISNFHPSDEYPDDFPKEEYRYVEVCYRDYRGGKVKISTYFAEIGEWKKRLLQMLQNEADPV